jgi:catechol 2,3-dioxygenase-like lactoylglutathione lyase family enzyme
MAHPDLLPIVITDALPDSRAFYVDRLGADVVMEMDTYVQVRFGDTEWTRELAFMTPDGPDQPTFAGGMVVSIAVDDADKHRARLADRGVWAPEPTDKPWGWRSFGLQDPNGIALDFFHEITNTADQDAQS